jgi:hypothetical protein
MKPRHAAALVLVGWYLMYPYDYTRAGAVATWITKPPYATAKQCRTALKKELEDAKNDDEVETFKMAQCVSAKDPRLRYRDDLPK